MTRTGDPARAVLALAVLALLLAGCTPAPEHDPGDADVVAARSTSAEELFHLRLPGGDSMTVVGDRTIDACGNAHSQQGYIGYEDPGLRCLVGSSTLVALTGAADLPAAAALVDSLLAESDVPTILTMVDSLAGADTAPYAPPPSIGGLYGAGGATFSAELLDTGDRLVDLQDRPRRAGALAVVSSGAWPDDVEGALLATGAIYFALVEVSLEYYDSEYPERRQ